MSIILGGSEILYLIWLSNILSNNTTFANKY